jgi:hypothetical protein
MGSDKVRMIKTSPHEVGARLSVCWKLIVKNKTGRRGNKVVVVVECYFFLMNIIVAEGQSRRMRLASAWCSFLLKSVSRLCKTLTRQITSLLL